MNTDREISQAIHDYQAGRFREITKSAELLEQRTKGSS
jgi:hypothetical protein